METRTENDVSRSRAGSLNHEDSWLYSLAELALELPAGLARMASVFFDTRSDQGRRGKPSVPPMSHEWLNEFSSRARKNDPY